MEYAQAIFTNSAIYIIATLGLAIFTGYTGLFSLGHAAFMAIGAYTTAILTFFVGWPFVPALLVGMLAAALVSAIIGYPTLRARLRSDYFAIATLGFGEAVRVLLENLALTQGARGLPGLTKFANPVNTGLIVIVVIWLCRNFLRSTYGRNIIAIGQDPVAAEMTGIRLLPNRMLSLAISAALAGLAGGLLAHYTTFIQPSIFSMDLSGLLTAGVVAGGMGSLTGPIVAMALFVVVPELFRGLALWRLVLYGVILVVIINYRPRGLFGYEELSVANLPKLMLIVGVTVALAVTTIYYNAYIEVWPTAQALLIGVGMGVLALAVCAALGYGLSWLLRRLLHRAPVSRAVAPAAPAPAPAGLPGADVELVFEVPAAQAVTPAQATAATVCDGPEPLLAVSGLRKRFGGLVAVDGIDLHVCPGEVVGLIGPNGSGKTTVFNLISGVYRPDEGSIRFGNEELSRRAPDRIVLMGVARTFQNIRLFSRMTALQNVQTALHPLTQYSLPEAFVRWPRQRAGRGAAAGRAGLRIAGHGGAAGARRHGGRAAALWPPA